MTVRLSCTDCGRACDVPGQYLPPSVSQTTCLRWCDGHVTGTIDASHNQKRPRTFFCAPDGQSAATAQTWTWVGSEPDGRGGTREVARTVTCPAAVGSTPVPQFAFTEWLMPQPQCSSCRRACQLRIVDVPRHFLWTIIRCPQCRNAATAAVGDVGDKKTDSYRFVTWGSHEHTPTDPRTNMPYVAYAGAYGS